MQTLGAIETNMRASGQPQQLGHGHDGGSSRRRGGNAVTQTQIPTFIDIGNNDVDDDDLTSPGIWREEDHNKPYLLVHNEYEQHQQEQEDPRPQNHHPSDQYYDQYGLNNRTDHGEEGSGSSASNDYAGFFSPTFKLLAAFLFFLLVSVAIGKVRGFRSRCFKSPFAFLISNF